MNFSSDSAIGAVSTARTSADWFAGVCRALMLLAYRWMLQISILARQLNY